jgi:hypothetical protein
VNDNIAMIQITYDLLKPSGEIIALRIWRFVTGLIAAKVLKAKARVRRAGCKIEIIEDLQTDQMTGDNIRERMVISLPELSLYICEQMA